MFNLNLLRSQNQLFKNIDDETLKVIMESFQKRVYPKNTKIIKERQIVDELYLVVSGKVEILDNNNEEKNSVNLIEKYGIFGYNITLSTNNVSRYDIIALEESEMAFISKEDLLKLLIEYPQFNSNMIEFLSNINSYLIFQLDCLSKSSIKEKIFEVLKYYSYMQNTLKVVLPFNKNQLANFLSINRSSLSRELSKMQEEGVFTYENRYYVLNEELFVKKDSSHESKENQIKQSDVTI